MEDKNLDIDGGLTKILPFRKVVTVANAFNESLEIKVRPYKLGQLPSVMEEIKSLTSVMTGEEIDIFKAVADHTPNVLKLVAMATGCSVDFIEELHSDDGLELIEAVFEVNKDFFIQKVAPVLQSIMT